jgi:hypothetical protein
VPKIPFALSAIFETLSAILKHCRRFLKHCRRFFSTWGALSAIFSIFFQKKLALYSETATIYIKQGKQEKTSQAEKVKNI